MWPWCHCDPKFLHVCRIDFISMWFLLVISFAKRIQNYHRIVISCSKLNLQRFQNSFIINDGPKNMFSKYDSKLRLPLANFLQQKFEISFIRMWCVHVFIHINNNFVKFSHLVYLQTNLHPILILIQFKIFRKHNTIKQRWFHFQT